MLTFNKQIVYVVNVRHALYMIVSYIRIKPWQVNWYGVTYAREVKKLYVMD